MELLDTHAIRALPGFDGPLASLGDGFVSRFHSWHGASGRRYVMSVFAADLPEFESCIVMPVARVGRTCRALGVFVIERGHDRRRALASVDVDEWHVHLLAGDRRERAAVASDLSAHYCDERVALSA